MPRYTTKDEIDSFEFHDSIIKSITYNGSDMKCEIQDSIVIGISCLDIPNRKKNSMNLGIDRYAEPILELTFQNYKIVSLLQGGCRTIKNNIITEEYPSKYIECEKYTGILQDVAKDKSNVVYSMKTIDNDGKHFSFDFWGGSDPQYYTIELLTEHIIAEWDSFGKEAWYLEHYRQKRKN